jgi:hypothetical protein
LDRVIDGKNPNTFLVELNSISRRFGRNQEGGESGSVTITKTGFSAELARVKAKTLSGSSRVSWVRSGPGRVTELRYFPYPGVVGLAGLS